MIHCCDTRNINQIKIYNENKIRMKLTLNIDILKVKRFIYHRRKRFQPSQLAT